jgi:hypothetical protein
MSNEKRFTLRMDGELFETIKQSASKNRRSVAKEIEYILFQWRGLDPDAEYEKYDSIPLEVDGKPVYEENPKE